MISERLCQSRRMEIPQTKTTEIVLNGERREVPAGLTLEGLLLWLQMDPSRVAVEFNGSIVRRPAWAATESSSPKVGSNSPGSQIEVVWFVGGGSF